MAKSCNIFCKISIRKHFICDIKTRRLVGEYRIDSYGLFGKNRNRRLDLGCIHSKQIGVELVAVLVIYHNIGVNGHAVGKRSSDLCNGSNSVYF